MRSPQLLALAGFLGAVLGAPSPSPSPAPMGIPVLRRMGVKSNGEYDMPGLFKGKAQMVGYVPVTTTYLEQALEKRNAEELGGGKLVELALSRAPSLETALQNGDLGWASRNVRFLGPGSLIARTRWYEQLGQVPGLEDVVPVDAVTCALIAVGGGGDAGKNLFVDKAPKAKVKAQGTLRGDSDLWMDTVAQVGGLYTKWPAASASEHVVKMARTPESEELLPGSKEGGDGDKDLLVAIPWGLAADQDEDEDERLDLRLHCPGPEGSDADYEYFKTDDPVDVSRWKSVEGELGTL